MSGFFISVIIPTYNRACDLDRCLKSLEIQTYKNFEVLVCDDGSTDNTEQIVLKYNSKLIINYIKDENFGGPAKPRNNGIKKAKGDLIAFLDSDDWWYPTKLEESIKYFDEFDLVYHDLDKFKIYNLTNGIIKGRNLSDRVAQDLIINGGIPNSSVLIKKSIINIVGEFSEDKSLIAVEDSDFWIRTALVTQKFKYIEKSLGGYWIGNNLSVSENQITREESLLKKYKYLLSDNELNKAEINLALRKARIFHKIKKFKNAYFQYKISFKNKSFVIKIKSLIGIISSLLRIKL
jgi:glycosyltransferase involved in cell wall biosynthesis